MSDGEREQTRDFRNRVADGWRIQVGHDGDSNRILNSDPVLWKFAGDVSGLTVPDAGCGAGYLSKKLCDPGARDIGVDFSERRRREMRLKPVIRLKIGANDLSQETSRKNFRHQSASCLPLHSWS